MTHQEFISLYQSNPKSINNEEKSKELAHKHKQQCYYAIGGDLDDSFEECYQSAIEAMQWKDKQFEERCKYFLNHTCFGGYYNRRGILDVTKLFDDLINFIKQEE